MRGLSIFHKINQEKASLVQHEENVLATALNKETISLDAITQTMKNVFNVLSTFNHKIERIFNTFFTRKKDKRKNDDKIKLEKEGNLSRNIIKDFKKKNQRYLKKQFILLCKRLTQYQEAIDTVKIILSGAFNRRNVENAIYFLKAFSKTKGEQV